MHTPQNRSIVEKKQENEGLVIIIDEQKYKIHPDEYSVIWEKPNIKARVNNVLSAVWTGIDKESAIEKLAEVLAIFNGTITKLVQDWESYRIKKI